MSPARDAFEVLSDPPALAERVARWMTAIARAKKGDVAVALSGGSTPRLLYRSLARRKDFPWKRVHWFWGDERFVPQGDPMSNFRMAKAALLGPAGVASSQIHPIPTEGLTPDQSACAYEQTLRSHYGAQDLQPDRPLFDVTLLGLGMDGHTASLFPGSPALAERARWTASVPEQHPPRITLTFPALDSSAHVAFLVTGSEKRDILRRLWQGGSQLPAEQVRSVGELWCFVDNAEAG